MSKFIKVSSEIEILTRHIDYENKIVVDVGCGTGNLTRFLAGKAERVIGIDKPELIEKASGTDIPDNVVFLEGSAQKLPLHSNSADIIIFFASFHHIPANEMSHAVSECRRVLKKRGLVCFIEPYAKEGSYYELTRLLEDEADIQKTALAEISEAAKNDFVQLNESFYYLERNLDHFLNQLNVFVADEKIRRDVAGKAEQVAAQRIQETGSAVFQSLCRANILMGRN